MSVKFSKEDLEKLSVGNLVKLATERSIVGRHKMKKCELIDSLLSSESPQNEEVITPQENTNPTEEAPIQEVDVAKMKYLDNIEVGTIVAFKTVVCGKTKVKSAAVLNISARRKELKLANKVGIEFIVPFSDIIWVRTTTRWPKAVYELLKGVRTYGEENNATAGGEGN